MKTKIAIDLPTKEKLIAGLDAQTVHPDLARAEQAVAVAQGKLDKAKRDLADRERLIAEMPSKVHAGQLSADALIEATRRRDVSGMLVAPAEAELAKARERLTVEEANAKRAVRREFVKRVEMLERTYGEVAPVLDEINELANALAWSLGRRGAIIAVDWPESPALNERMGKLFR